MSNKEDNEEIERPVLVKSATDLQRLKLAKLMQNVEKPILLPERPKCKNSSAVPEFIRNVMGSSAGAGSGEFHVYRHLRRKEYSRQKCIQEKGCQELLDEKYHEKVEDNKKRAEEATLKKRIKRLKKKQKKRQKKLLKVVNKTSNSQNSESDKNEEESGIKESEDMKSEDEDS